MSPNAVDFYGCNFSSHNIGVIKLNGLLVVTLVILIHLILINSKIFCIRFIDSELEWLPYCNSFPKCLLKLQFFWAYSVETFIFIFGCVQMIRWYVSNWNIISKRILNWDMFLNCQFAQISRGEFRQFQVMALKSKLNIFCYFEHKHYFTRHILHSEKTHFIIWRRAAPCTQELLTIIREFFSCMNIIAIKRRPTRMAPDEGHGRP